MDNNNFEFTQTYDALSELSTLIANLDTAVKNKGAKIENDKKNLETQIDDFRQKNAKLEEAAKQALHKIDNINKFINEVL